MNAPKPSLPRGVSKTTLFAGVMVVAGALLAASVDMIFLLVFGAGVFGPGVLREMGFLKDHDEFQREASRAAGYRAYLTAGVFLCAWLAVAQRGTADLNSEMAQLLGMVLILLMVVWLLSTLFGYWDARKATALVLPVFGCFWLLFVILSHVNEPGRILPRTLVAAPVFVLGWSAQRWPRVTGVILVLVGGFFFFAYDMYEAFESRLNAWPVILLMFLPLMACGLALLRARQDGAEEG